MKTIISPARKPLLHGIRELGHHHELLWMLAYRDYKVRYAQTFLGLTWAVIQPLLTLLIFILIFHKAAHVQTGKVPYPLFAMTGMWAWSYLAFVMMQSGNSIIASQSLITKVYFPRLILPVSKSLVGFIDFSIAFIMLVCLAVYYGHVPPQSILWLPLLVVLIVVFSCGTAIWLSALTIRFRDVQYVVPFVVQIGLYVSPVAYPSSMIPETYRFLYYLNPMAAIMDAFRGSVLGWPMPEPGFLMYSILFSLVLLFSGMLYFKKVERVMADII